MTRPRTPTPFRPIDPDAYHRRFKREIVDRIGMWAQCGRPACRRARACRVSGAPCFEEQKPTVQDCVADLAGEWCRLADVPFDIDTDDLEDA